MSSSKHVNSSGTEATASADNSTSQLGVIASVVGIGFLALLWYFGFVLILWLLFIASAIGAIACAVGAAGARAKDGRNGFLTGAGAFAFAAILLWQWIASRSIDIPSLPKAADAQRITAEYKDRVAFIQVEYASTVNRFLWQESVAGGGFGSGVLLANDRSRGVILTNRHVIDPTYTGDASNVNALAVRAKLASEDEWHAARVVAIHPLLDMALVLIEKPFKSKGAVRIADHRLLQQGEAVVALGNPLGIEFVTTEGIISQLADDAVLTSCPISPGNSGGPLILRRRGLVAGINTLAFVKGQNLNVAVPAEWAIRDYPPLPAEQKSRGTSHPVFQLIEAVGEAAFSSSSEDSWSWQWISDQDTVIELLNMVPMEEKE